MGRGVAENECARGKVNLDKGARKEVHDSGFDLRQEEGVDSGEDK